MDIDDNNPYFPSKYLTLQVDEEKINAPVGSVATANDDDFLPENRIMCYYLYGKLRQRRYMFKFARSH